MKFNAQDRKDYKSYLLSEIELEEKKHETIAREYNLTVLRRDLWNMEKY